MPVPALLAFIELTRRHILRMTAVLTWIHCFKCVTPAWTKYLPHENLPPYGRMFVPCVVDAIATWMSLATGLSLHTSLSLKTIPPIGVALWSMLFKMPQHLKLSAFKYVFCMILNRNLKEGCLNVVMVNHGKHKLHEFVGPSSHSLQRDTFHCMLFQPL